MNIQEIVVSQDFATIQKYFNETSPNDIFVQMEQLKRKHQRILFQKADPNIQISDLLPEGISAVTEVIHSGMKNVTCLTLIVRRRYFRAWPKTP